MTTARSRRSSLSTLIDNVAASHATTSIREHGIVASISPNEKVFCLPDGKWVENFKKGFSALLVDCGFVYAEKNDRHVLTSLRHSYATFSLTRKWGKRVSMRVLAMQMGTSEKMIDLHYGHDQIVDYTY